MAESKIIVALDGMVRRDALDLADILKGEVWGFKANDLLDKIGTRKCIYELGKYGKVMADPKLYDIPNTMKNRIEVYFGGVEEKGEITIEEIYQADIVTVMACAGMDALIGVAETKSGFKAPTDIAVVTVLTSFDEEECNINLGGHVKAKVLQYARNAVLAGCDEIVCSAQELLFLEQHPELQALKRITPGIRPKGVKADDQKRINTPEEAVKNGADKLVIGRAITEAEDPLAAAQSINEGIEKVE